MNIKKQCAVCGKLAHKCELSERALRNLRAFLDDGERVEIDKHGHVSIVFGDGSKGIVKHSDYGDGYKLLIGNLSLYE